MDALQPDSTAPMLIALHGSGGDASMALEDWAAAAAHGWRVVAPQSSVLIGPDEYSWLDWQRAAHELGDHLATLRQQYQPARSMLAGFSWGGGVAITLAALSDLAVNGFIAVAPAWPDDEVDQLRTAGRRGPHGFIIVGGRDARCVQQVEQVRSGLNATIERYPELGHAYPPDWAARLPAMLTGLG